MIEGSLKIAFVTPEAVPYAKTGGLADVSGSLPPHLCSLGHTVRLFMPKYSKLNDHPGLQRDREIECRVGINLFSARIHRLRNIENDIETFFIDNANFFDRSGMYTDPATGDDYKDNDERFIFFCKAFFETLKALDWKPDIIHLNDWQTALIPSLLKLLYGEEPFFQDIATVLTIHNMGYQGIFPAETFAKIGFDSSHFFPTGPFEFWGGVNFMKSGIYFADMITTVSPTYAQEIQQADEFGKGLRDVLKQHRHKLTGILNGADYSIWSPEKDRLIPHRYSISNLSGKKRNKLELLHTCGFPIRMEHPLLGIISRLDRQKGFDLLEAVMDKIMQLDIQFVLLGTGDEKYHEFFKQMALQYPDKFKAFLTFSDILAHLIEAGSDIFLMPSHYEPCGLNQMYSLRYGTVPIVRKTGGLADTVVDFDEKTMIGTGFVFDDYDPDLFLETIRRAVDLYRRKRTWYKIMKQGMRQDFSWHQSAQKYSALYNRLSKWP